MRDSRKMFIYGGSALLLLILGFGLFFLLRGDAETRAARRNPAEETDDASARDNTLTLARNYAEQGEYQAAMDLLNRLLIENSSDEEANTLLQDVLQAKRDAEVERSRDESEALRRQNEELASSLERLGESLNRESPEEATARARAEEERRREEEARRQEVEDLVTRGRQALNNQDYDEAIAAANSALRISPDSYDARRLKTDAEKARQDAESAAERQAREQREREIARLLEEARTAVEDERWADARDAATRAQALDPDSGEAYAVEGDAWLLADQENARKQAAGPVRL